MQWQKPLAAFVFVWVIGFPALPPASAQSAKPKASVVSFAGKTVTILIPYSVGGSADIMARMMLPYMAKHFPGNPTVIVNNMPGGGGIIGENWVYNVGTKDGTLIGQFSTIFTDAILQDDKAKFELGKFRWLGGVRETAVGFVHTNLGIKRAEDLPKVGKKIFLGDNSLQSPRGMFPRLFLKILGVDHKFIGGYGSSGDQRAALRRGELNMTSDSFSGYSQAVVPMVKEGVVVPLAQEGTLEDGKVVRDPELLDVPTYSEILLKLKGESVKRVPEFRAMELLLNAAIVRRGWVYVEGVPNEIFSAMAAAFEKFLKDTEMQKTFEKAVGFEPQIVTAAEAQKIADAFVDLTKKYPQAVQLLKEYARKAG
jgi:tripartite-type tricarboxylate transporter receptor subunit TctC